MTALITTVLAMIGQLLPLITSSANASTIASIISTLEGIIPYVVDEVESIAPAIKNIIAALSANPATTAGQLAALQTLDATVDAAFEAAAAATDAQGAIPPASTS
jgi:hypothetical protein